MKKQFLNLGKALSKAEQREIFGGAVLSYDDGGGACATGFECEFDEDCKPFYIDCIVCRDGGCAMA
ncbi:hypothetical protein [Lutibacter sp.]